MANTRKLPPPDPARPDVVPVTVITDAEHKAQAQIEGTPATDTVEFDGVKYKLAPKIGYLPLLRFAHAASAGTDSESMEGMAAMYDMLRGCFDRGEPCGECDLCVNGDPGDCLTRSGDEWRRFERHALRASADDVDLFAVVSEVIAIVSARPTRRRSGSSPPEPPTSARSRAAPRSPEAAGGLVPVADLVRSAG